MNKTISYRASQEDLNILSDLEQWLSREWKNAGINKKVTMSDVLFQAIMNDWQNKCLPFTTK